MALTNSLLFVVIFIVGLTSIYTDIKERRIYNFYLLLGLIAGGLILSYASFMGTVSIKVHSINGILALMVGCFLSYAGLLGGGDAKLFALLSFLMPPTGYESKILSTVVVLFSSSFLMGTAVLIPGLILNSVLNRREIAQRMVSEDQWSKLHILIFAAILIPWVLFPVYFLLKILIHSKVFYIFTLILLGLARRMGQFLDIFRRYPWLLLLLGVIGFLSRWILLPESLAYPAMQEYLLKSAGVGLGFFMINLLIVQLKFCKERVPFAVLLVTGCLVSYTPLFGAVIDRLLRGL